jgi:hypothetical protein
LHGRGFGTIHTALYFTGSREVVVVRSFGDKFCRATGNNETGE